MKQHAGKFLLSFLGCISVVWLLEAKYLTLSILVVEEDMATHSRILAWRMQCTEEPGGLQSIASQWVSHGWNDLAHRHSRSDKWQRRKGMELAAGVTNQQCLPQAQLVISCSCWQNLPPEIPPEYATPSLYKRCWPYSSASADKNKLKSSTNSHKIFKMVEE